MINPLISVIIPTYNWSNVLKLAISTVLWQTYQNFEIIVVGDACTDDSEEIVKSFNDPRIKWHNLDKNYGGQAIPNNIGIEMSQGDYIAHLGHDDIWHPKHLELLLEASTGELFLHSLCISIGPDNEETDFQNKCILYGFNPPEKNNWYLYFIPPSAMMYKKELFYEIGPWKDYKEIYIPPDKEFQKRAFRHCKNKIAKSKQLTVLKFNSAWRKDSYILKPCHQQEEYINEIKNNENFLNNFLFEIIEAYKEFNGLEYEKSKNLSPYSILEDYFTKKPDIHQIITEHNPYNIKGYEVKMSRIYRGLDKESLTSGLK
jgi:glycosyltransferase involved in cell wall biosynthesis